MNTHTTATASASNKSTAAASADNNNNTNPLLEPYEASLNDKVDAKFFEEPSRFRSLDTVIEVLGSQLDAKKSNSASVTDKLRSNDEFRAKALKKMGKAGRFTKVKDESSKNLKGKNLTSTELVFQGTGNDQADDATSSLWHYSDANPVYHDLKEQQNVVEEAIEHMVVHHVEALNKDVGKVAEVSKDFHESIGRVKTLRRRVQVIKGKLGNSGGGGSNNNRASASAIALSGGDNGVSASSAASPENKQGGQGSSGVATKSLRELWLQKLECEAVLDLLGKIEEIRGAPIRFDQLVPPIARHCRIGAATVLLAKATDTLFLHTSGVEALAKVSGQFMLRKEKALKILWNTMYEVLYLKNGGPQIRYIKEDCNENQTMEDSNHVPYESIEHLKDTLANEDILSDDDDFITKTYAPIEINARNFNKSRMISLSALDTDLKLESDEIRYIDMRVNEEDRLRNVARYTDSTMALRILVSSLSILNSLEDVERTLSENLNREIRKISEQVQENTYAWIDKKRMENNRQGKIEKRDRETHFLSVLPKEVHRHFYRMLLAFENVLLRYCHLAQIVRQKMKTDKEFINKVESHEDFFTILQPTIELVERVIQEEIKCFLRACLNVSDSSVRNAFLFSSRSSEESKSRSTGTVVQDSGFFSLGIINENSSASEDLPKKIKLRSIAGSIGGTKAEIRHDKFVPMLFADIGITQDIRHALLFRPLLAKWTEGIKEMKIELAAVTGGEPHISSDSTEESALEFLDLAIERQLLPLLQSDAMDGTIGALERDDAFAPVLSNSLYLRGPSDQGHVELCRAAQAFLNSTTPLFAALHQLPKSGENLSPLVAVMEHATLTFVSRGKQRIRELCNGKTADALLGGGEGGNGGKKESPFLLAAKERPDYKVMLAHYGQRTKERRSESSAKTKRGPTLRPSSSDTKSRHTQNANYTKVVDGEGNSLQNELQHVESLLRFSKHGFGRALSVCSEEDLYNCASIAHSLLKLSEELDNGLRAKDKSRAKTLMANKALRSSIGTIRALGLRMALFCRVDVLVHTIRYMSKICNSDVLVSEDGARVPPCVNDLGEFLAATSDNMHETAGSVIASYALSSLEEYIPLLLMRVVEIIGTRDGLPPWYGPTPFKITMHGVESLERCCNTLQRDLKSVAYFEGSSWNEAASKESFKHAASYISLLELDGNELMAYMRLNWGEFSEDECRGMFAVNAPRRKSNPNAYDVLLDQMIDKKSRRS